MLEVTRFAGFDGNSPIKVKGKPFEDHRGGFIEAYRELDLSDLIGVTHFVQGNVSVSHARVVRGLHYQVAKPQGKFMRTVAGQTVNVAVDVRLDSPTFGRVIRTTLLNPWEAFWVPPGFANGFCALQDNTVVAYECSTYYQSGFDRALNPLDPSLDIDWGFTPQQLILSEKDKVAPWLMAIDLVPQSECG